jgi:hypothetical protein
MLRYRGDEMKLLPCLRSGEIGYGDALAENSSATNQLDSRLVWCFRLHVRRIFAGAF